MKKYMLIFDEPYEPYDQWGSYTGIETETSIRYSDNLDDLYQQIVIIQNKISKFRMNINYCIFQTVKVINSDIVKDLPQFQPTVDEIE